MDFFGVSPKCRGLIINRGAILEKDLHFYNIVVPGEVKRWKHKKEHCRCLMKMDLEIKCWL